jgi:hypothetical protein
MISGAMHMRVSGSDEQHRHECECRYWWKETGGNAALIKDVLERVAKKRSAAGVEKLRQGLAEIWRAENGK